MVSDQNTSWQPMQMHLYHRFKFGRKVMRSEEDSRAIRFTTRISHESNEEPIIRRDDNNRYHQFRDELLVIDSIIQ